MILARSWQFILLSLSCIGFIWFTFIVGSNDIVALYYACKLNTNNVTLFIAIGYVLSQFVTPLMQVL